MNYFRKDWILFQEIANEGGKLPEVLIPVNAKEANPDENKHVPFIEKTANGYVVKTGKNEFHATAPDHHTMFIELRVDDKFIYKQMIALGEKPEATFNVPHGTKVEAYAFCNLHGMWKFTL